jgi:cytochrome c oxidase assembly protein subunit 15
MKSTHKSVVIWLYIGIILIFMMTFIGGITRLTHSGLSIVSWSIFSEAPLFPTTQEWMTLFEQYQQTPEFKYINADFTLDEFKSIFWWEYIHRMWGRMMGFIFIIPYLLFTWKKMISKALHKRLLIVLVLGAFQGFLGWYMVKSGLINEPSVSHFRLAAHLITAFLTCSYIYWIILEITCSTNPPSNPKKTLHVATWILSLFVLSQIIFGAFVAGLKAGFTYNTFPTMNGEYFPAILEKNMLYQFINSVVGVQFIHRMLAYSIVLLTIIIYFIARNINIPALKKIIITLYSLIGIQVLLGIFTLLYHVPITLGLAHQLVAFILLLCLVRLNFELHYSTKSLAT